MAGGRGRVSDPEQKSRNREKGGEIKVMGDARSMRGLKRGLHSLKRGDKALTPFKRG